MESAGGEGKGMSPAAARLTPSLGGPAEIDGKSIH